jgi:dienelactone hydrolase
MICATSYHENMKLSRMLCLLAAGILYSQTAADPAAVARKGVDLLLSEKYSELFQLFSPQMQKDIPEAALPKIAAQFKGLGTAESIGQPETRKAGPNTIVVIPVKFSGQSFRMQMAVNPEGQLTAMVPIAGEVAWQRPSYSKPDSFSERQVTIGQGDWKLPGVLSLPKGDGPFPAVVLVHGFGPNDRDESVGGTKMFRDLADGLGSRGIVVLRYDKRSRVYGPRWASLPNRTANEETVEDAVAAANVLRAQKEVDPKRIYVLGHDLGGYLAPRIAVEDEKLAGLIILAGHVRPLEDLIVEQAVAAGTTGAKLDALKSQAARVKSLEPADADLPPIMGMPPGYWLDLKGYNPAEDAKKLSLRMLILQGERDSQVPMKDFGIWKTTLGASKPVEAHSYPALNHLFVAGEGKSTEAEYRKPGHVAPEVVDEIAKWISSGA